MLSKQVWTVLGQSTQEVRTSFLQKGRVEVLLQSFWAEVSLRAMAPKSELAAKAG